MGKRRTRKEKEAAHHRFLISWQHPSQPSVKREFKNNVEFKTAEEEANERSELLAKPDGLAAIKRDVVKSLILASLILALEVVIYLAVHS